jgi:hypothetical protein
MGRVGLEHTQLAVSKTAISDSGGAKSGAHDAPKSVQYPDKTQIIPVCTTLPQEKKLPNSTGSNAELAAVIEAWPALPEHIKMAILIMVKGAGK